MAHFAGIAVCLTLLTPIFWVGLPCGLDDPGPAIGAAAETRLSTRDPEDIPFSSESVWNVGIGSGAKWGHARDADVQQLRSLVGVINAAHYGQPIYFGTPSDPLVTVTDTDTTQAIPPQQIHVPISAAPAGPTDGDGHMNFYDATQRGKMWSYYKCSFDTGHDVAGGITCRLGGVWDTTGDGVFNAVSPGSDYNFAVGTITRFDLAQHRIRHALRVAIGFNALKSPGTTWTEGIPWPNTHEDSFGPERYTGRIIAGSTFGIPARVDLRALGLSEGGMMLAKTLQDYGAIFRDSSADGTFCLYSVPENEDDFLIRQMRADLSKIMPYLNIMRNQGPAR